MPSGVYKRKHTHTYIYGLIDPDTLLLRYIGQSVNPMARLSQHLGDNNWIPGDKHEWMNSLIEKGGRPFIVIFERVGIEKAPEVETEYIDKFKETVFNTFKRVCHPITNTNKQFKQRRSK